MILLNMEQLLCKVKHEIENKIIENKYFSGNGKGFEDLIYNILLRLTSENINIKIINHFGHHFPDITVLIDNTKYGIELKSRNNGSWSTNGNSVFESISMDDYEEIYILFGSKDINKNKYFIEYSPYWQSTAAIIVTHSPRFKIDMKNNSSIFVNKKDYDNFRNMNENSKTLFVQNYFKDNKKKKNSWYIPESSINLKPEKYSNLNVKEKEKILCEMLILFPIDLLKTNYSEKNNANYEKCFEYMYSNYFCYSTSLRDIFTAGGKWKYHEINFPQILKKYYQNRYKIREIFLYSSKEFKETVYRSWDSLDIEFGYSDIYSDFLLVIDRIGEIYYKNLLLKTDLAKLSDILIE